MICHQLTALVIGMGVGYIVGLLYVLWKARRDDY